MSFFPIPLNKNYTGQKKLKTASDERLPKPKTHTIKYVRDKHKEFQWHARALIKTCSEQLEKEQELFGDYDYARLAISTWYEGVFNSLIEAKTFIKIYEKQIIEYASS